MMLSDSAKNGKKALKDFQKLFNPCVESYFETHTEEIKKEVDTPLTTTALLSFKDLATRKCKRLRASFVYHTYKMFGGPDQDLALNLGIVIELVHAYLLAVDDFMDVSTYRRGGLTTHEFFKKEYESKSYFRGDPIHYGNAIAVNVGLIGCHMAMNLLNSLKIDDTLRTRISHNLNHRFELTGYGQMIDVTNSYRPNVTEQDVLDMLKWKTGVYTYENPIHTGALAAGATKRRLNELSEFAISGGISFQIQDDILGMFGDPKILGKSVMDDLKEGKYTLLIHKALENATPAEKKIIEKNLGNRNATDKDHNDVKQVIKSTGSLDYSKQVANDLVTKAIDGLNKNFSGVDNKGKDYLVNIATYVVERDH